MVPVSLSQADYPIEIKEGIASFPLIVNPDKSQWQTHIRLRRTDGSIIEITHENADELLVSNEAIIAEIITDRTSKLGNPYKKGPPVLVSCGANQGKSNQTSSFQQAIMKTYKLYEKTIKTLPVSETPTTQPATSAELITATQPITHTEPTPSTESLAFADPAPIQEEVCEKDEARVVECSQEIAICPMLLGVYQYDRNAAEEVKETRSKFTKQKTVFPCYIERKYDGLRCCALYSNGRVILQSRGQCLFTNLRHLEEEFAVLYSQLEGLFVYWDRVVFDGELYIHGQSLEELNSVIRSRDSDSSCIQMHIFDIAVRNPEKNEDLAFEQRLACMIKVNDILASMDLGALCVVQTAMVYNQAECKAVLDSYISEGFEGAVLRLPDSKYVFSVKNKRSSTTLKYKQRLDMEVRVVGALDGNGRDQDAIIYVCKLENGSDEDTFNVVMNAAIETRKAQFKYIKEHPRALEILKQIPLQIEYAALSERGMPEQPRGIRFRYDLVNQTTEIKLVSSLFK